MSLQLIIGTSGTGKSTSVYKKVIQESIEHPESNYFIIVPDQFTMQTQKDLVNMSPRGGIMNIDVLSFSRLAYRIFEETGGNHKPVLDDTGKSLILRKVAADLKTKTPVIGAHLDKQGYIHEVKSAISEFMQYGIGKEELNQLIEYARPKGSLYYKLKDLSVLYDGFVNYIKKHYITTEESMNLLSTELYRSKKIKDSVVVLDGFTGFTPIQNKVIGSLLELCKQVMITLTMDEKTTLAEEMKEQDLFVFTKKTYQSLLNLAQKHHTIVERPYFISGNPSKRFENNQEMAFLEQNLFRYPLKTFCLDNQKQKDTNENGITIYKSVDIHEEVRHACRKIQEVLKKTGCCYRDIAVIAGDLSEYESEVEQVFANYQIPIFMDKTRGILLNPFTEYLDSVLDLVILNFSYEAVFRYLRTGMTDFTMDEIDRLENYVIEMGIRGKKAWSHLFVGRTKEMKKSEEAAEQLGQMNELRERLMKQISPFLFGSEESVQITGTSDFETSIYIKHLYEMIVWNRIYDKLIAYEDLFQKMEDYSKAKEYGQIYGLILNLFDQIMDLIGNEKMKLQEFKDILDAGLNEIEIGSIPQSVDRVIVGDMERTRLKPIQYLFFLGMNDGFVPKSSSKGGIISDMEREYLTGSEIELAPSPRQQMYIQKFYLYLNLTKPAKRLFLSYSGMKTDGSANRPSYLIPILEKMFPETKEELTEEKELLAANPYELKEAFCVLLRKYADGRLTDEEEQTLFVILKLLQEETAEKAFVREMVKKAFASKEEKHLDRIVAGILYGKSLLSSVSRMEKYAACEYAYFLQYGLSLKEREQYGFEDKDIGTIFHGVLEHFSDKLAKRNYTWFDFPKEETQQMVAESLEEVSACYSDAVLFDNALNRYTLTRMQRILSRAVNTISYQLNKGRFIPAQYEIGFSMQESLGEINVALNTEEKMKLNGRIDRMDTFEEDTHIYVKVVDYKSGNKDFSLASFYHGLQLQLVVYLNEAMKLVQNQNPSKEVIPAALLYYHVADPLVEGEAESNPDEINQKIYQELRTKGLVNSDSSVIESLDISMTKKSDCIPVDYKADGSFTAASSVASKEELQTISEFATYRLKEMGKRIYHGSIHLNPVTQKTIDSCTYCSYHEVCGFDMRLAECKKRQIEKEDEKDLINKMEKEMKGAV